jgi:hypothetical protein
VIKNEYGLRFPLTVICGKHEAFPGRKSPSLVDLGATILNRTLCLTNKFATKSTKATGTYLDKTR